MKLNVVKKIILCAMCVCFILLVIPAFDVYAGNDAIKEDGKYTANVTNDLFMGGDNLSSTAIIEKTGKHCYVTFTVNDAENMTRLKLILGNGEVGCIMKRDNNLAYYTYSISERELENELHFTAFIPAMSKQIEANLKVDLNSAEKISDKIDDLGERPAEFVPVIEVNADNTEVEKGTNFLIPVAKATLCGEEIEVKTSAYYLDDGNKEDIDISGGNLLFEKVGVYHIIYRAESNKYKTSFENNTFKEIDIQIVSKVGAVSIAKTDKDALPKGYQVQAAYVKSGETFDKISSMMIGKHDNFEIINLELFSGEGQNVALESETAIYLKANESYNRNKIVLYTLDENMELCELEYENYGRYIKTNLKEGGTFIICLEGVEFVMPMWGYAAIAGAVLVALIAIIVVTIVLVRRRKQKQKI